jgi:hypothetical protein
LSYKERAEDIPVTVIVPQYRDIEYQVSGCIPIHTKSALGIASHLKSRQFVLFLQIFSMNMGIPDAGCAADPEAYS